MYFILDHVSSLSSERYIIGAAVACFVWDFILTFHDEVEYIWKRWRWEASRFCFFWTRYSGLGCFLYAAYLTSGLRSPVSLQTSSFTGITLLAATIVPTLHVYHASRVLELWQLKQKRLVMCTVFLITFVTTLVSLTFAALNLLKNTQHINAFGFDICYLTERPTGLIGVYICMLVFDSMALFLILSNALHQPYREGSQVLRRLQRDGTISYIFLISLSIVVLTEYAVGGDPNMFIAIVVLMWTFKDIIVLRFILRVESVQHLLTPESQAETPVADLPPDTYELRLPTPASWIDM